MEQSLPTNTIGDEIDAVWRELGSLCKVRTLVEGFTIDPSSARDLDDGFCVEHLDDGCLVFVSISDVAALIRSGSKLDNYAFERAFTRYKLVGSKPMFPGELSHNALSLLPNQDRLASTLVFPFDKEFELQTPHHLKTTFRNVRRFNYVQASGVLSNPNDSYHRDMNALLLAAEKLFEARIRNSPISLIDFSRTRRVLVSETGAILPDAGAETAARFIVQEFMIASGLYYASEARQAQRVIPFRNHRHTDGRTYSEWAQELHDSDSARQYVLRQQYKFNAFAFPPATYAPVCEGHCGLGTLAYAHSTSPIRRYADIEVQRGFERDLHFVTGETNVRYQHLNQVQLQIEGHRSADVKDRRYQHAESKFEVDPTILTPDEFGSILATILDDSTCSGENFEQELTRRLTFGLIESRDVAKIFAWDGDGAPGICEIRSRLRRFCAQNWGDSEEFLWPFVLALHDQSFTPNSKPEIVQSKRGFEACFQSEHHCVREFGATQSEAYSNARAALIFSLIGAEDEFRSARAQGLCDISTYGSWESAKLIRHLADAGVIKEFDIQLRALPGARYLAKMTFEFNGLKFEFESGTTQSKGSTRLLCASKAVQVLIEGGVLRRHDFGIEVDFIKRKNSKSNKSLGVTSRTEQANAAHVVTMIAQKLSAEVAVDFRPRGSGFVAELTLTVGDKSISGESAQCTRKDLAKRSAAQRILAAISHDPEIMNSLSKRNFDFSLLTKY